MQALNYALSTEAKLLHSSAGGVLKTSNEQRIATTHFIPNNLKNLPSAITVTTVPKIKSTSTNSPSSLWNRNCGGLLKTKSSFTTAAKSNSHKEKKFKADAMSKVDVSSNSIFGDGKRSNKYLDMSTTTAAEKTNVKIRNTPATEKGKGAALVNNVMAAEKGLTITPVISKDAKSIPSTQKNKIIVADVSSNSLKSKSTAAIIKADTVAAPPLPERPSLIITPVDTLKSAQTLQQKLAAKQLANVPTSKNTGTHANFSVMKQSNAFANANKSSITGSFDISKSLGSSGVSIFPLPTMDSGNVIDITYPGSRLCNTSDSRPGSSIPYHKFVSKVGGRPISLGPDLKHGAPLLAVSRNVKQTEIIDVANYKSYNKALAMEAASIGKTSDEKLKNALKALEASSNIIITPKVTIQKSELEVITLE